MIAVEAPLVPSRQKSMVPDGFSRITRLRRQKIINAKNWTAIKNSNRTLHFGKSADRSQIRRFVFFSFLQPIVKVPKFAQPFLSYFIQVKVPADKLHQIFFHTPLNRLEI